MPSPTLAAGDRQRISENKRLGVAYPGELADFAQNLFVQSAVDLDLADGFLARRATALVEVRDVYMSVAEHGAELADVAGLILFHDVEHVRRELGVEVYVLNLDQARTTVGKHRARDAARGAAEVDRDLDVAFIRALLRLA